MINNSVSRTYFKWLCRMIDANNYIGGYSYRKLLTYLYDTEFLYLLPMDENRAGDGIDLRHRFACEHPDIEDIEECLYGACSVLEMMVALAIRCEEEYMDNPQIGDRTAQWFWGMINSLGLSDMCDRAYDKHQVRNVIIRFLDRRYEPDGKGGLFRIRNCEDDLRDVEIWYQLQRYLNTIT